MKKMTRILSILMAAIMALTMISTAFAATTESVTIDTSKEASLTVYKFDICNRHQLYRRKCRQVLYAYKGGKGQFGRSALLPCLSILCQG